MRLIQPTVLCLIVGISFTFIAIQPMPLRGFGGQAARATAADNHLSIDSIYVVKTDRSIDLFYAGHYLILECPLNNKPAYFLVDTGASFTILHSKFAKLYDFDVVERRSQQTTGFGGTRSSVEIAIGTRLKLGNQEISMGFLAQDLSKLARLIRQESNVSITGIIGTDLLKRLGGKIDLGQKTLVFK